LPDRGGRRTNSRRLCRFDANDEWTAFSVNRKPDKPYYTFARRTRLDGVRIGVVREYMDKALFSEADVETIDIVNQAIGDLQQLGATIVDPGEARSAVSGPGRPRGSRVAKSVVRPGVSRRLSRGHRGRAAADHIAILLDMYFGNTPVPHTATGQPSLRNLGGGGNDSGDTKYFTNLYLQDRGDTEIRMLTDLYTQGELLGRPAFPSRKTGLMTSDRDLTLNSAAALQNRFATQTTVFQCSPRTSSMPSCTRRETSRPRFSRLRASRRKNDRGSGLWTNINSRGFPAMTVPAGFTTQVYDRAADGTLLPADRRRAPRRHRLSRPALQ